MSFVITWMEDHLVICDAVLFGYNNENYNGHNS